MKFPLQYAKILSQKFLNIDDDIIPEIEMCLEREGDSVSIPFDVENFEIKIKGNDNDDGCGYINGNSYENGDGYGYGDNYSNSHVYYNCNGYGYKNTNGDGNSTGDNN